MVMRVAVATLAAVAALCALVAITSNMGGVEESRTGLLQYPEQQAQMQMLPEFQVAGEMKSGEPAPQGIPLSVQLPVPLPAPSPPAPTVITVGGSDAKGPVCKRCEQQMRKIKVTVCHHLCPSSPCPSLSPLAIPSATLSFLRVCGVEPPHPFEGWNVCDKV